MKRSYLRLGLVAIVACSDPTQNAGTERNLDRPVDISFACHGGLRITNGQPPTADQEVTSSAQPLASCTIQSGPRDPTTQQVPKPPGQEDIGDSRVSNASWYAFILQSGPGTVAIAQFDAKPAASFGEGRDVTIVDSDPLTPGTNGISVGEEPIAIATDRTGCYEVIANAGSCDLSVLSVDAAVDVIERVPGAEKPKVARLEVKNATGQVIRARPAAMVFEPTGGTIGVACPANQTGLAYIAYPSCHLVAGVDVATGTIVTGIQYDAAGVPMIVDGNVTCPAECDAPAAISPGVRPVALDLEVDPRTGRALLAIGADNSNVLSVYDLDTGSFRPLSLTSVPLSDPEMNLGVFSLAISPVMGMGGSSGVINDDASIGGQHQFIYAVATDGTVRVADIEGAPRECDTQVDPRFVREIRDIDRLSCFTAGDAATPPRRAGARGPGIALVGDAVPTAVDIFKVEPIIGDGRPQEDPARLIGYFAFVTAANGQVYTVNIDNDDFADFLSTDPVEALKTVPALTMAHQLRDAIGQRDLIAEDGDGVVVCDDPGPDPDVTGGNIGGPRVAGSMTRTVPAGVLAGEKFGGLPSIRQVLCESTKGNRPVTELSFSAPLDVRFNQFPDLRALRSDEVYSLTWEGSLSLDKFDQAIDGPAVRDAQIFVDGLGMHLVDESRPFCDAGAEPFDIVQLRGCDPTLGDAGCPIGYTCYVHPQSQVAGLGSCMLIDEAEQFSTACRDFMVSMRRYTVGRTTAGELRLLPRKHVLRTTPLDGCTDDAQCETLADYALSNVSSQNPVEDTSPDDARTYRCQVDPDRAPLGGTGKRCLMTCATETDCAAGMVCRMHPDAGEGRGYCMEGVVPPQACVNALQRFELRAGEAFAVVGTRSGYHHSIVTDAAGNCVKSPTANPYDVSRVPLVAPPCDPTADPLSGRRLDGTFEPNPCKVTVEEAEYMLNYVPGTCSLSNPDETLITRQAEAIQLRHRGMNLTIVDPSYPGDARCHGDRAGTLTNIPLVMPGFSMAFRIAPGFSSLIVPIQPAFPIKVVRGPLQSAWVIDEGDFLSTSISSPSTRGRVFRIESGVINSIDVLD